MASFRPRLGLVHTQIEEAIGRLLGDLPIQTHVLLGMFAGPVLVPIATVHGRVDAYHVENLHHPAMAQKEEVLDRDIRAAASEGDVEAVADHEALLARTDTHRAAS